MYPNTTVKNRFDNSFDNKRYRNLKSELYNHDYSKRENLSMVKFSETASGYHFELKIPGYIKDDFYFYLNRNDLVVTTAKRKKMITDQTTGNKLQRHSYCYPSAFFIRKFAVPNDIVRNEIYFDYQDEILRFDLVKSKNSKKMFQ